MRSFKSLGQGQVARGCGDCGEGGYRESNTGSLSGRGGSYRIHLSSQFSNSVGKVFPKTTVQWVEQEISKKWNFSGL